MATIEGHADLRKRVEERTGALADDLWRVVAPPSYEDSFDASDVAEIVEAVRSAPEFQATMAPIYEHIRDALGLANGVEDFNDVLFAIEGLGGIIRSAQAGSPTDDVLTPEAAASVGRLTAAVVAAEVLEQRTGVPAWSALRSLLGFSERYDGEELLGPYQRNLVKTLSEKAARSRSSTFGRAYQLFDADMQISKRLLEEGLWVRREISPCRDGPPARLPRFDARGQAFVAGTWEERWTIYEAEFAPTLGRHFASATAYKVAATRAAKRMKDFLAEHGFGSSGKMAATAKQDR